MKKLKNTIESADSNTAAVTDNRPGCGHCGRTFVRESTLYTHNCEPKRRWLERHNPANRIAYSAWSQFYSTLNINVKTATYERFAASSYYTAFVKWGHYCVDARVLQPLRWVEWLLKNRVRLHDWASDVQYTRYLQEYLRQEDPLDALARSVSTTVELADGTGVLPGDILRWGNVNRITHAITTGRISPWMLYCSDSGKIFLDRLDETQVKIVYDYINPEQWALVLHRKPDSAAEVKQLLAAGGY